MTSNNAFDILKLPGLHNIKEFAFWRLIVTEHVRRHVVLDVCKKRAAKPRYIKQAQIYNWLTTFQTCRHHTLPNLAKEFATLVIRC